MTISRKNGVIAASLVGLYMSITHGVSASAADVEHPMSISALGGVTAFNNNYGGQFGFGGDLNFKFHPSWSVGFTFNTAKLSAAPVTPTVGQGQSQVTANDNASLRGYYYNGHINYYIPDAMGIWVGGRAGVAVFSGSETPAGALGANQVGNAKTTSASATAFDFGPSAGIDYMIHENISLGVQLDYLFSNLSSTNNLTGKSMSINAFNAFAKVGVHF